MDLLEKYREMLHDREEWGALATFVPNKREPVYNWLYYKEGFSKELVFEVAKMFGAKSGTVLDPFCGSGTTLLACKQLGLHAVGYDVLPISLLASYVKTRNYDIEKLRLESQSLLKTRFEKPAATEAPGIVKKAFSRYALDDIFFFRKKISQVADEDCSYFMLLALAKAAMSVSYAWKDGAVIKIRKRNVPPLRLMLKRVIKRMLKELEGLQSNGAEVIVEQCDSRRLNLPDSSVDYIITSPPYLNQIDYTKVYAIENFIISRAGLLSKPSIRSYIGMDEAYDYHITDLEHLELPLSAKPYFTDMNLVLEEMHRVCKSGAKAAIVVGNGYVEGRCVDSDLVLAYLAEKLGFAVKNIFVLNKRFALENRTEKKGILRESMIILEKA